MKEFLLKSVLFFTLFLIVFSFIDSFFTEKGLYAHKREEYEKLQGNLDIAIFGSSHALCSYDPRVLEVGLNANTYNFGASMQFLQSTLPVIEEVIDNNNLQLAIVDIFKATLSQTPYDNDWANNMQLRTFDYLPWSWTKLDVMNRVYGLDNILNQLPLLREHSLWKERLVQPEYYFNESLDYYKGYYSHFSFNEKRWTKSVEGSEKVENNKIIPGISLSQEQFQTINRLIQKFRENNVPILFVNAPLPKGYRTNLYYTYQELIREYLQSKNVEYIDFNDLYDVLNFSKWDFRDIGHLNSRGAVKVSNYLVEFVRDNFQINQNEKKYLGNRYYHLDTNLESALFSQDITDSRLIKLLGVNKIGIYRVSKDNLEVMFLGEKNNLKYIKTTVTYQVNEGETNLLEDCLEFKKYFNKDIFKRQTSLTRGLNYKEYEVKTLRIPCQFEKLKNFKVFIGGHSLKQQEVLNLDNLISY
ncbi:SGNH/GDSL hydrolase family protein [Mangrovimonas sp. TPBH4]|uniref:SGNH/GDSL hydrolase family protein n=1 Tax=Mangrovimonas sp. TPBH4 TaxID=1645914 RepID=UPI0006B40DE4|nr:SGNH/GDSL hydrolase family protein [Mangrovimonas sp. TPBH4]